MQTLGLYLRVKKEKLNTPLEYLHKGNKYLTDDEIEVLVNIAKLLGTMGMGIDRQVCLDIVNAIIQARIDRKNFKYVTKSVVEWMLRNNQEIIKLVHSNAIDLA